MVQDAALITTVRSQEYLEDRCQISFYRSIIVVWLLGFLRNAYIWLFRVMSLQLHLVTNSRCTCDVTIQMVRKDNSPQMRHHVCASRCNCQMLRVGKIGSCSGSLASHHSGGLSSGSSSFTKRTIHILSNTLSDN